MNHNHAAREEMMELFASNDSDHPEEIFDDDTMLAIAYVSDSRFRAATSMFVRETGKKPDARTMIFGCYMDAFLAGMKYQKAKQEATDE
jgi:hypothetical protein